jgi:DNA-binding transcriptional LysR family regulator
MALTSLRDIELVRALAEHRHFGRAAASLGISQPAVSRSLAQLEASIGEPLFERSTMHPTAFGKIVLRLGDRVLAGFAEIAREIVLLKGLEVGELKVAMGPYPADVSGQRAGAMLSGLYPSVALDLRVVNWMDAIEAVHLGRVDLAFAEGRQAAHHPELEVRPVRRQPLTFVCRAGHPLAGRDDLTLPDLLGFPWVGPVLPGRVLEGLPQAPRPFGVFDPARQHVRPRILVETVPAMKEVVRNSDALTAALPFQVAADIADGTLCLLMEVPLISLDYGFILRRGRTLSPAAKVFMDLVLDIEAKHPVPGPLEDRAGEPRPTR